MSEIKIQIPNEEFLRTSLIIELDDALDHLKESEIADESELPALREDIGDFDEYQENFLDASQGFTARNQEEFLKRLNSFDANRADTGANLVNLKGAKGRQKDFINMLNSLDKFFRSGNLFLRSADAAFHENNIVRGGRLDEEEVRFKNIFSAIRKLFEAVISKTEVLHSYNDSKFEIFNQLKTRWQSKLESFKSTQAEFDKTIEKVKKTPKWEYPDSRNAEDTIYADGKKVLYKKGERVSFGHTSPREYIELATGKTRANIGDFHQGLTFDRLDEFSGYPIHVFRDIRNQEIGIDPVIHS